MSGRSQISDDAFARMIEAFTDARDKDGAPLSMSYVGAANGSTDRSEEFGTGGPPVDLRSVSKVLVSLTVGRLIDEGLVVDSGPLGLTTRVGPLLDRHFKSEEHRAAWSAVELQHLLSNTIGHAEGFLFRKDLAEIDEAEFVRYALSKPIDHPPGSHFSYSNVGPYLTSVLLQDTLGDSLHSLATTLILGPLGIDATWRDYGSYTAGCTGLTMRGEDLLKIGRLLVHRGLLNGHRLVSEQWVDLATKTRTLTPSMYDPARVFPKYSYGLGFWVCKDGTYYIDGTDGQYLIVVPHLNLVIATTGAQADMKPITRAMEPLLQNADLKGAS